MPPYSAWLAGAFLVGLSQGVLCMAPCGALLAPLFLSNRQSIGTSVALFLRFSAGRFVAYVFTGACAGGLGSLLTGTGVLQWLVPVAYAAGGILMLRYVSRPECDGSVCTVLPGARVTPFVTGFVAGISPCPPFLLVLAASLAAQSVVGGALYFAVFFLGTTICLAPLMLLGRLPRWRFWSRVGRLGGAALGLFFISAALSAVYDMHATTGAPLSAKTKKSAEPTALISNVFPAAAAFETDAGEPGVFRAYADGHLLGYAVDTTPLNLDVRGYAGPTPLVVAVDSSGTVLRVAVHSNRETTAFLNRVYDSGWWHSLTGRVCTQVLATVSGVDAVSGATYTSSALKEHVRTALRQLETCTRATGGLEAIANCPWFVALSRWVPTALILLAVTVLALRPAWHTRKVRWVLWIAVVAVLGFWRPNYYSVAQLAALIHGNPPKWQSISWYLVLLFALLSPLFIGRAYCRHACPFGVLSEMLASLSPVHITLPAWTLRIARIMRFALLGLALLLIVFLPHVPTDRLEPFNAVFVRSGTLVYVAFGIVALVCSAVVRRFWCVFFCLDGALFELLTRFRWKRPGACRRQCQ